MVLPHVIVAWFAIVEIPHAGPADMRLTAATRRVIASISFLHWCGALGTVLDVELLLEFLQRIIVTGSNFLIVCTCFVTMKRMA